MKTPRAHSGLTLIEIMMGLAIVAVLSAMALPALSTRLERQRLVLAAETLAADLTEARFEAARQRQGMSLLAVPTASADGPLWCWAVVPTASSTMHDCSCASHHSCGHRVVSSQDHPGVKMVQGRRVQLSADGSAVAGTAAVFESPRGERLRVDLLALGRSRICSMGGEGYLRYPAC